MFKYVTLLLLSFAGVHGYALGNRLAAGLGLESRAQQQVNPSIYDARMIGQISLQYRFWPWTATVEGGYEAGESNTGPLSIQSNSLSLGAWGRREFKAPGTWSPFATGGMGMYFDKVTSTYLSARDERTGRRGFFGAGGGLTKIFAKRWLFEAEGRGQTIEDRQDVNFSAVLRLGFFFDGGDSTY